MTTEDLLALTGIFLAAVWSPGPNNAMLAASGATFGFRPTIPHVGGVALGFAAMIFLVGLGLGRVFELLPWLTDVVRVLGIALLTWVAWRIATARRPGTPGARSRPFTFLQACAFQWVNPKAWAMCLSIAGQFVTADATLRTSVIVAAVSAACGITSATGWAGFGHAMQRVLRDDRALRLFNLVMAALVFMGVLYLAGDLVA